MNKQRRLFVTCQFYLAFISRMEKNGCIARMNGDSWFWWALYIGNTLYRMLLYGTSRHITKYVSLHWFAMAFLKHHFLIHMLFVVFCMYWKSSANKHSQRNEVIAELMKNTTYLINLTLLSKILIRAYFNKYDREKIVEGLN